jgi:ribokinase
LENKKITVIGSINMDIVTSTNRVPMMGETVMGESFHTLPGGKGANQAVAAARLGAEVYLVGCVGDDSFGTDLLQHLKNQGVHTDYVEPVTHTSTGTASTTIANGDNHIIVVPGANYAVTPEFVAKYEQVIAESDVLMLQLEIPLESVEKAVEIANKHHVKVILNPAPIQPLSKELMKKVDYLTPNEYEQQMLFDANEWTDQEREEMMAKCIITRGAKGITFYQNGQKELPSYKVKVVDTTGAGDSFNGALAVSLSNGATVEDACQFAIAVGALSVTKLGAQGGMPTREEVHGFLQTQKGNEPS